MMMGVGRDNVFSGPAAPLQERNPQVDRGEGRTVWGRKVDDGETRSTRVETQRIGQPEGGTGSEGHSGGGQTRDGTTGHGGFGLVFLILLCILF